MTQAQDEGTCLAIESARPALAVAAIEYQFSKNPELRQRYDEQAARKCKQDTEFHLAYLAQAIGSSSPGLFAAYVQWAAAMLSARNVARSELAENLDAIRAVIFQDLPAESAQQAAEYVDYAAGRMNNAAPQPSFVEGDDRLAVMAREYLARLLRGDRRGAGALLSDAAGRGTPLADIYLRVIQPALYEVGRLWQANEISVAQEHFCSAATQLIMAQFYPLIFKSERRGKTLVAACASGELHEIGLRAVADFFEMAGWDTHYLGASVPVADLLRMLAERRARVLALSATIAVHIGAVRETIRRVRASAQGPDVLILVGGYPFNIDRDLWRKIGADGNAEDAASALQLAGELLKD